MFFRFLLCAVLCLPALALAQDNESLITVHGFGSVFTESNQGSINASVSTEDQSAQEALASNNARIQSLFDALNGVGISEDNVETTHFSFQPKYVWVDGRSEFDGYLVSNAIRVTITDIDAMGMVLDLLVDAGASNISSISFESKNTETLRRQAMAKATRDAHQKALALANQTGVILGDPVKITLSPSVGSITPLAPRTEGLTVADVPISPGGNTVTASVMIAYRIEN